MKYKEMVFDVCKNWVRADRWSDSQDGSYGAALNDFYNDMKKKYDLDKDDVDLIVHQQQVLRVLRNELKLEGNLALLLLNKNDKWNWMYKEIAKCKEDEVWSDSL